MEEFDEVELRELEELEKLHKATEKYLKKSSEKKESSENPVKKNAYKNNVTSIDDIEYACNQVIPEENYEIGHEENGFFRFTGDIRSKNKVSLTIHFPKIDLVNDQLEPINHTIRDFYIVLYLEKTHGSYKILDITEGFRTTFSLSELTKGYVHSHMNTNHRVSREIFPYFFCIGEDDIFRNRIKYNKIRNIGNLILFLNIVTEAVGVESKQGVPYINAETLPVIEDYLQVDAEEISLKNLLESCLKSVPAIPKLFNLFKIEPDKKKILKALSKIVRFSSGDKEIYIDFYKNIDDTLYFLDLLYDIIVPSIVMYSSTDFPIDLGNNDALLNSTIHVTEKGIFISKPQDNSVLNNIKDRLAEIDDSHPSIYFKGEERFLQVYDRDMLENSTDNLKVYKKYEKGALMVYGISEALKEFKIETIKKLKAC